MSKEGDYIKRIATAMNRFDRAYINNVDLTGAKGGLLVFLYALEDGEPHTQKEISEEWMLPRTTINSIVKKCEKDGFIKLKHVQGTRREMEIQLTEAGRGFADKTLSATHRAEYKAMSETLKEFSPDFIQGYEKLAENIEKAFEALREENV